MPWEHQRGRGYTGCLSKTDDNSTKYVEASQNEERAVRDLRSGLLSGCPLDMRLGSMRGAEGGRVSF